VTLILNWFPSREAAPEKDKVNRCLRNLTDSILNKRCLVLDGTACNSVDALRACEKQSREASDLVVPNICTQTYLAIKATGSCFAYHGSSRAYMDTHKAARFGLVYLDYCCRLRAGAYAVEKSPICDIEVNCLIVFSYYRSS